MSRRKYIVFAIAYIIIPVGVNAIVVAFSFTILAPLLLTSEEFLKINQAGQANDLIAQIFSYMSFIVNLPIINATVSFAGWGLALVGTIMNFYNHSIHLITMSAIKFALFNILMANLCFVFVYYIMDIINKNFIRKILPNENLSEISKTVKISIRSRFFIFYITVAVTPCILLVDLILSILYENQISGYYAQTGFIFSGILLLGTILTFVISNSFAYPITSIWKS
jgi:hypothetical protein